MKFSVFLESYDERQMRVFFIKKIQEISKIADVYISRHFLQRINDRGLDPREIQGTFQKFFGSKPYRKLTTDKKKVIQSIVKDLSNELNISITYDNKGTATPKDDELELVTVMKKKDFNSNNPNDKIIELD